MDMLPFAIAVVLFLFGGYALVKVMGWRRRREGAARLGDTPLVREAHDVDLRVLLFRTRIFRGMQPGRSHPVRGDLLLTDDRFVVASDRGTLADLRREGGRRFRSVRCTGPRRLVIEGEAPGVSASGLYRFELVVEDAEDWADALAPFVEASSDGPAYGSMRRA